MCRYGFQENTCSEHPVKANRHTIPFPARKQPSCTKVGGVSRSTGCQSPVSRCIETSLQPLAPFAASNLHSFAGQDLWSSAMVGSQSRHASSQQACEAVRAQRVASSCAGNGHIIGHAAGTLRIPAGSPGTSDGGGVTRAAASIHSRSPDHGCQLSTPSPAPLRKRLQISHGTRAAGLLHLGLNGL